MRRMAILGAMVAPVVAGRGDPEVVTVGWLKEEFLRGSREHACAAGARADREI